MTDTGSSSQSSETQVITVHYWASARSAAGTDAETVAVDAPVSLNQLLTRLVRAHPGNTKLLPVLECCSVLLGERPINTEDPDEVLIGPGATVEFLPPFAGG